MKRLWLSLLMTSACSAKPVTPIEQPAQPKTIPTATASAATVAPPAAAPSQFALVHRSDESLDVIELDDVTLLGKRTALLALDGDVVRDVTGMLDGIGEPKEGLDLRKANFVLAGLWGRASGDLQAWIQVGQDESNVGRWFNRHDGKWVERKFRASYELSTHDESWLSETDLANGGRLFERYERNQTWLEVDGAKPAVMPILTKGTKGCVTRMVYHSALRELSDGSIVGAGQACTGKDDRLAMASKVAVMRVQPTKGPLAVETWPKGVAKARFEVLPGDHVAAAYAGPHFEIHGEPNDLWITAQVAKSGDEFGATYVAHFDGAAWRDVSPACELPVSDLVRSERVFVFCGDRGYRRDGQTWTPISLPIHGPHLVFGPVVAAGKASLFGLSDDAIYRFGNTTSSFERVALPEIDGKKLRGQKISVSRKGEVVIVAVAKGPDNASFVFRYVGAK